MARRRKGRWEGDEFLPMLSATELARPYVPRSRGSAYGQAQARRRGEQEHDRFDRDARRHMPRLGGGR